MGVGKGGKGWERVGKQTVISCRRESESEGSVERGGG